MRLFKCFDSGFIDCKEQVLAVFAESQEDALRKCVEIHKDIDVYDDPEATIMNEWTADEFYLPIFCDAYICYPKSICGENDVRLVMVDDGVQDIEKYIMNQLIEFESEDDIFREYAKEISINSGLLEQFYQVDGKYAFNDLDEDFPPRDDILDLFNGNLQKASRYINECMVQNVHYFFSDCPSVGYYYLTYLRNQNEDELDEDFYIYVARKLIREGKWLEYEDIRKVGDY